MRIALARALFINPTFLILDEPTNHLDLEACVWLEDFLAKFNRILLMVSHSQDFLNGVCTNIIHMHQKQLKYYSGARANGLLLLLWPWAPSAPTCQCRRRTAWPQNQANAAAWPWASSHKPLPPALPAGKQATTTSTYRPGRSMRRTR
jgi:energy-coupling factor transporter ATP-binding protein EcfA2